jgi:hypothetical protein
VDDITHELIEEYLCKIFTGKELLYIDNGSMDICIEFRQPTNAIILRANLIYHKAYQQAISDGILSAEDLEKLIKERNIFTTEDEQKISKLESQLHGQEVLLSKTVVVQAKSDRLKNIIRNLRSQINEIKFKKSSKMSMSAESKADEERSLFLCWACAHDADKNSLLWQRYDDLLKEQRLSFKDEVLINFLIFNRGINTRIIRRIARSNIWRIRYVTSLKASEQLFGVPTSEYTNDMLNLAYWSNYYQSIYEMLPEDRPTDSVIEDDEALDAYMQSYYDDRNQEDMARRSKHRTRGKLSAFDKEEVIITKSNELYEDIKYDKPREAQKIKDKAMIRKKARRSRK